MPLTHDDHSPETEKAGPGGSSRRSVIAFNLIAGLLLWFGYCTDYSLAGTVPDYCFPPLVALAARFAIPELIALPVRMVKSMLK